MDDAAFEAQRERVMALVQRWKPVVANEWLIHLNWSREPVGEDPWGAPAPTAEVSYSWDYMEGGITFHLPRCEAADDEELERTVVHELSHFLIAEAIESSSLTVLRSRKEHLTTQVQRAIMAAAGLEDGRYD